MRRSYWLIEDFELKVCMSSAERKLPNVEEKQKEPKQGKKKNKGGGGKMARLIFKEHLFNLLMYLFSGMHSR